MHGRFCTLHLRFCVLLLFAFLCASRESVSNILFVKEYRRGDLTH